VSDTAWRGSQAAILAKLREDGLAIHAVKSSEVRLGAFYEERARRGAPLLVTFDALFAVTHLALASVAADVEERSMRGELGDVLHRLDARLGAEVTRARPDLLEGYRIARTTVAIALALFDPTYAVPVDLVSDVALETALVRAHAGVSKSPLFEVQLDYGLMLPRGSLSPTDPRAGTFQAAAWLANAPFLFAGEGAGARIDVGAARSQARAALLLARLLFKGRDKVASAALAKMVRVDRFWLGDADELSPVDLAELAGKSGIDLGGGSDIASAAKLDHLRHAAGRGSMRLIPLRAPPDNRALDPKTPSALEVGAWLRTEWSQDELGLHSSVYASLLEAMATWLRPSKGEVAPTATPHDAEGRRKLQTVLAAWTFLRHDALAFAHDVAHAPLPHTTDSNAHPARVFVEAHPEAIASLLGAVQQLHRGLHELGALDDGAPGTAVLVETEALLALALEGAVKSANEDPAAAGLEPQLAQIPARIAALEAVAHPAAAPVVIDVHVDMASGRVLEEATAPLEELFLWVHDPVTNRAVLVVGATIRHIELVQTGFSRLDDAAFRASIAAGKVPDRDAATEPEIVVAD
jgi:hypothetical protein